MELRKNILKHAINFDGFSQVEEEKMVEFNQFFFGLHLLVGLADQVEACLKIWESIIHKDRKVGSIPHGGYSNGESGVTRLMRTVCKPVQERGCEKSGKIVCFATYLRDEFGITSILLFPFLGNRFNILFANAAGVYFLYDQLLDFFRRSEHNNKLLDAVYWDLEVLSFKIGCSALGLIEKLITGPLWKIMAGETHIVRMSSHYQNLLEFLEPSSEDCSKILRGESFCDPSFITRDECLIKLLEPCDEQTQLMTKQCLEIVFGGLKMVTRQMLHDHLDDGKYGQAKNLDCDIWSQTKSVATTNVESERDFGMLDRLMKIFIGFFS